MAPHPGFLFVSCGCCIKLSETGCLRTVYSVIVLEARGLKSGGAMLLPEALGRESVLGSSRSWWLLTVPWLVAASLQSLPQWSHHLLSVCLPLSLSYKDACDGIWCQSRQSRTVLIYLSYNCKDISPPSNKVTFTGCEY